MRSGKFIIIFSIAFLFIFSRIVYSQTLGIKKYQPLSGRLGLSIEGGTTFTLSDFSDPGWSYFGRFTTEYFFPSTSAGVWGIKGITSFGYLQGSGCASVTRPDLQEFKTSIFTLGGGGEYLLKLSKTVYPYVFVGAAYLYFDPQDMDGNPLQRNAQKKYSKNEWTLIAEGGFKFKVSEDVSLNLGLNMNYVDVDNLDDIQIGTDNDIYFSLFGGVTVYFLGINDSDGDGVSDDDDLCPDTPPGVIVDPFGCPVDTDNDGVPDYLDQCPNTPANVPVDTNGCFVDSDGDGVPDYLDLCKNTPEGAVVDKRGCAKDTDSDGVPDYRDDCPNTPIGVEVNKYGCTIEIIEIGQSQITTFTLSGGVNFEVGSAKLLPASVAELNVLVNAMKSEPESIWKISGYTDNTGSYETNMKLSYDRANSVANYLVLNGISPSRLGIKGYGPADPIADNSTAAGRALNRRVVVELLSEKPSENVVSTTIFTEYDVELEKQIGNMIFTDGNVYCFQVAAFRNRKQADNEVINLRNKGENAFVVEADIPALNGIWYRVRIGYFDSLQEAKAKRKNFNR